MAQMLRGHPEHRGCPSLVALKPGSVLRAGSNIHSGPELRAGGAQNVPRPSTRSCSTVMAINGLDQDDHALYMYLHVDLIATCSPE